LSPQASVLPNVASASALCGTRSFAQCGAYLCPMWRIPLPNVAHTLPNVAHTFAHQSIFCPSRHLFRSRGFVFRRTRRVYCLPRLNDMALTGMSYSTESLPPQLVQLDAFERMRAFELDNRWPLTGNFNLPRLLTVICHLTSMMAMRCHFSVRIIF